MPFGMSDLQFFFFETGMFFAPFFFALVYGIFAISFPQEDAPRNGIRTIVVDGLTFYEVTHPVTGVVRRFLTPESATAYKEGKDNGTKTI